MTTSCTLFIITLPNDQQQKLEKDVTSVSFSTKLKTYLDEKIKDEPVWTTSIDNNTLQIVFHAELGIASDQILRDLNKLNISKKNGCQVCILPATVIDGFRDHTQNNLLDVVTKNKMDSTDQLVHSPKSISKDATLRKRIYKQFDTTNFKKSVRARLIVHQVVAGIRANTRLSFDFLVLLTLASMIASFGFMEGSAITIVSSMLLSPLMHPIMGIVFGLSVGEPSLWRRGIRNELIGLTLCIFWGFIMGLCLTHAEPNWGESISFPTLEMKVRGNMKRIWIGVLKALLSGAGVALSVLGGNTGSLVGAALSASLLPPAVNCGLLWAYASLAQTISDGRWGYIANESSLQSKAESFSFQPLLYSNTPAVNCSRPLNNDYMPYYSCDIAREAAILGSCSFLLTILNVICIIIMALIVLRIKEVVPLTQANEVVRKFFHHDIKLVRDYNRTMHERDSTVGTDSTSLRRDTNVFTKSIVDHIRNITSSARDETYPPTTLVDMNKLQSYARDFNLNVFDDKDRELLSANSEEKVICLIKNLLDMYEEEPSAIVDLCRYQPYGALTSARKEHFIFYEHLIELLPEKWYNLLVAERRRRLEITQPNKRSYSFSEQTSPFANHSRLHQSLNEHHIRSRFLRISRTNFGQSHDIPSTIHEVTIEPTQTNQ